MDSPVAKYWERRGRPVSPRPDPVRIAALRTRMLADGKTVAELSTEIGETAANAYKVLSGTRAASSGAGRQQDAAALDRRIAKLDKATKRLVAAIADGAADFPEIREALAARRAQRDALVREKQEISAAPVIALNPRIAEAYRKRVRALATHLNSDGEHSREVVERLRDIISGVR